MNLANFRRLAALLLGLAGIVSGTTAHAADTDVFANPNSGYNAPNVLFVMDTGASFSASNATFRCGIDAAGNVYTTAATVNSDKNSPGFNATAMDRTNGGVEQCALYSVIKSIAATTATVNIGVMMFNSNQKSVNAYAPSAATMFSQDCINGRGGCLALPIVPLNSATAPRILDWIKGWNTTSGDYNIKAPASRGDGSSMQEAWAYFKGKTGISGRTYTAPASPCGNNYVVFIGNAFDNQASPKDQTNDANSPLKALNATASVIGTRANPVATTAQLDKIIDTRPFMCGAVAKTGTVDGDEGKGAYALNWALYMKADSIKTYSVGVTGPTCDTSYVAQLDKLGEIGGGRYFGTTNFDDLVNAFKTILGEIQSVNSVFAAVSLPVSVNTQGSYLNQVFVGMFRPQKNFYPQWSGNLKQYKLGLVGGVLRLMDASTTTAAPSGQPAINPLTGFITECAQSFWSQPDAYWALEESGGCLTVAGSKSSNAPDGNIVEKGAQAQMLRGGIPANRRVKTCDPVDCSTLTDFNTANLTITSTLLGSATFTATTRDKVIAWARGSNVENEMGKGFDAFRPGAHGDVVHSRPIPVNHGTADDPNIIVYYGGNDGMLRAVNGNRTKTFTVSPDSYPAGSELWAFMPPEFYPKLTRLITNTPTVAFPSSTVPGAREKDYGIDGPITAFQGKIDNVDKTYVYATMRRGGRAIYAFDVTAPASPLLLWKVGCPNLTNDTGCSDGYSQMGQTWSSLKTMHNYGYENGKKPLLIAGGGYDACEDYDAKVSGGKNHNCTLLGTRGNRIYVIDAATGKRVKSFPTDRAVIADVTLVRDSEGQVLYGYTADLGGNVYRLTFGTAKHSNLSANWTIDKIASLGCATPAACTDSLANRKFMFAPSVSTPDTIGSGGETYYIAIGSGDREKPVKEYLASKSVQNYFYMIKDKPGDTTWLTSENVNCTLTDVICMNSLFEITTTTAPTTDQLNTKPKGWALRLGAREQVVTSAITIFGVVTYSTHVPAEASADACKTDLGETKVFNISYLDASGISKSDVRSEDVSGDGLPPSPVAGRVTLDDGTTHPFCIGCSKDSPLEGAPPLSLSTVKQPTGRLYWYIQK